MADRPIQILMQTTIESAADDWDINRFSRVREHLASVRTPSGEAAFVVTGRNLQRDSSGADPFLVGLGASDFDEAWIIGADGGIGLNDQELKGVNDFWRKGRGLLLTRDHSDMGSCLHQIDPLGQTLFFHSLNQDPRAERQCQDDRETSTIQWPNYHSGRNGDFQKIKLSEPPHEIFWNKSANRWIEDFPAHPHEGAVGVPAGLPGTNILASSRSQATGRDFALVVAMEKNGHGRGIAESSFHHFADYNWHPDSGCPSFVVEPMGTEVVEHPEKLNDIKAYVVNVATWLAQA